MGNDKETSPEVASKASNVMQDDRTGDKSKSSAASALSQAEGNEDNKGSGEKGEKGKKD